MEKNTLKIDVTMIEIVNEHGDEKEHNYTIEFIDGRTIFWENSIPYEKAKETPFTFYEFIEATLKHEHFRSIVKREDWKELTHLLLHFFNPKDSGKFGKIYEINTKLYLNGYRGSVIVSPSGKIDLKHKGIKYECKSNCGDLKNILFSTITCTHVIYSEFNERDCENPANGRIYELNDFIESFKALGLIRKRRNKDEKPFAIQSYRNSKRKHNALIAMQNEHPTIETIRQYNIM